jgi:hypothetical protein
MKNSTITITYGENVVGHAGTQEIGSIADSGISYETLKKIKIKMTNDGYVCKFVNLKNKLDKINAKDVEDAGILIVKNFVNTFFKNNEKNDIIFNSLKKLKWDKYALMRGRVVNKHARWNLCFADFDQNPDYENGKGRIYDFKNFNDLQEIKSFVENLIYTKVNAEGNYYYDTTKCYIGFHGDVERKYVIGVRFGENFPLYFQWYIENKPITKPHKIILESGDLYIMSSKSVGNDWKKKKIYTLRHAAGENAIK